MRFFLLLIFVSFNIFAGSRPPAGWMKDFRNIDKSKYTIAVFGKDSCRACRDLKAKYISKGNVLKELSEFNLVYINQDKKMEEKYKIKSWPSYLIFNSDFKEIGRQSGCPSKMEYMFRKIKAIKNHIKELDKLGDDKAIADYLYEHDGYNPDKCGSKRAALYFYEKAALKDSSLKENVEFLKIVVDSMKISSRSHQYRLVRSFDDFAKKYPKSQYTPTAEFEAANLIALKSVKESTARFKKWLEKYPEGKEASRVRYYLEQREKK